MARPKGYWVKVGVLGGIQVATVWGVTMWVLSVLGMDGDPNQIFVIAPCVGLFFGIVFPITMAWLERRSEAKGSRDEDA